MELALNNSPFNFGKLIAMLLVLCLLSAGVFYLYNTSQPSYQEQLVLTGYEAGSYAEARILEVVSNHAYKHGAEVNETINCIKKNSTWKTFQTYGFFDKVRNGYVPTSVYICLDPKTGVYYALVTTFWEKINGVQTARLITAYRIVSDIFPSVDDYIEYIKASWGARLINYTIEAGQILLDVKY